MELHKCWQWWCAKYQWHRGKWQILIPHRCTNQGWKRLFTTDNNQTNDCYLYHRQRESLPPGLTLNTSTARNASTSFPVKAIPNYYDYPGDFKNKLSHQVTLYNYTAAGNGVPSIHAVTSYLPNGGETYVYPTNALTQGGSGYS